MPKNKMSIEIVSTFKLLRQCDPTTLNIVEEDNKISFTGNHNGNDIKLSISLNNNTLPMLIKFPDIKVCLYTDGFVNNVPAFTNDESCGIDNLREIYSTINIIKNKTMDRSAAYEYIIDNTMDIDDGGEE